MTRTPPDPGLRAEVRVGRPGALSWPVPGDPAALDWSTRIEVARALCERVAASVPDPLLWVTRSGSLDLGPLDTTWWATTRVAWGEQGLDPAFAVVTREGWRLLPEDRLREWRRVRVP